MSENATELPRSSNSLKKQVDSGLAEYNESKEGQFGSVRYVSRLLDEAKVCFDESENMVASVDRYNSERTTDNPARMTSRTYKKGIEVKCPVFNSFSEDIIDDLKKNGLYKYNKMYETINELGYANLRATEYVQYINGVMPEPYVWIAIGPIKMPMTKEQYELAEEHYDVEKEITTPPDKEEMLGIIKLLGYGDDVQKKETV